MKALFLTEGGIAQGMGHVNRCAALSDEFVSRGIAVRMGLFGDPQAVRFADDLGLRTIPLEAWEPEAIEAILEGDDLVVVDSYLADRSCYLALADRPCKRLWLDDGGRLAYPGGIVVNSSPDSRGLLEASGTDSSCELLCGPSFHPLRREFRKPHHREIRERVRDVLVMLGGSDPTATTPLALAAARSAFPEARIRAIVPRQDQRESWMRLLDPSMEMAGPMTAAEIRGEMEGADLAIFAGGQTLQEGLRVGLPIVAIEVATNQRRQMDAFREAGAILDAGRHDDPLLPSRLASHLEALSSTQARRGLATTGASLIDGLGTRRILGHVLGWTREFRLRDATLSDSRAVWTLATDPSVRAASFSTAPIPWETHLEWFPTRLRSADSLFLVAEDGSERVLGYLRADRHGTSATLSIALHPSARGRGEASGLLREATEIARRRFPAVDSLLAWIEASNEASRRAFASAGFLPVEGARTEEGRTFHLLARSLRP